MSGVVDKGALLGDLDLDEAEVDAALSIEALSMPVDESVDGGVQSVGADAVESVQPSVATSTAPTPSSEAAPADLAGTPGSVEPRWPDMADRPLLSRLARALGDAEPLPIAGKVTRVSGIIVEATLPSVTVGTACEIRIGPHKTLNAEVVGFAKNRALLMPFGDVAGVGEGCAVHVRGAGADIPVGDALLGRVVDAAMQPVDGGPAPVLSRRVPLYAAPPHAMTRRRISRPLVLGIRSLDACLTCGEGQRVGIMAGPGIGKSVLMGMLARGAAVDVIVVGLVGERGREVREFVERDLGPSGLARTVVVVATADEPPLVRVRAAVAATAVAEYFRERGKRVLLLIDSLSRVAMAQREIGLAAGEPPTSRGYPPSVFAALPRLVERAGNDAGEGSITAMYTCLAEGDDLSDPFVDAVRAAVDGHIVLSRKLADGGHFPAVDVLASISRVMSDVVTPEHRQLALEAREVLATYRESADLVEVGAYVAGSNPRVDRALRSVHMIRALFQQTPHERHSLQSTLEGLKRALEGTGAATVALAAQTGQSPSAALASAAGEAYRG